MLTDEELLKILACPSCHGSLELKKENGKTAGFICAKCAKVYPVRDDIPIMLVEEAIPLADWDAKKGF